MYLKIGDEYADGELGLLSELLGVLDEKIIEIRWLMAESPHPEAYGLTDRGEYFIGVGLSAIQQYLTDTLTLTGIPKRRAFELGPRYSRKLTFVAIVNAAANWWKHFPEWVGQPIQNDLAKKTQAVVLEVSNEEDYPLSNVLAELQNTNEITLCALLPSLILWRSAVDALKEKHA